MTLSTIADRLAGELTPLRFGPPVTHVYNPLIHARNSHHQYVKRYGSPPKEVVLVGMNPGPWGMVQTGVPFGEVEIVRDWLGIEAPVDRPRHEHPRRPVEGFACKRSEVSGRRLWGWARDRYGDPDRFFSRFFVVNYCPLVFMEASGRNRTPDKLPMKEREPLFEICDRAFRETVRRLEVRIVVGVGRFAERRAGAALSGFDLPVGGITHPSPANPRANQGWAEGVDRALSRLGVR